jgi:dolichol kinase
MEVEISRLFMKSGAMIIWFVVVFLLVFHFWRKKVRNVIVASVFPFLPAFLLVLPFYHFNIQSYVDDVLEILREIQQHLTPFVFLTALALAITALFVTVVSRKVRIGLWGWEAGILDIYRYRAAGQLVSMVLLFLFLEFTSINLAFLALVISLALFLWLEYFKGFYQPNMAEPTRPASRFRRIAYSITGTAEPEAKFYFRSLYALLGPIVVILVLPKFIEVAVLLLAFADPLATFTGTWLPKGKWPWGKTLSGSLVFFVASSCILLSLGYGWGLSLVTSALTTLIESFCRKGIDNFIIPVSASLFLNFLPL